ncbi:MAG: oligosaccharide flippase family protein [Oscillospiraceae bacterium]
MEQNTKTLRRNLAFNTAGSLIYFGCQWLITGLFVKQFSAGGAGLENTGLLATAMAVTNIFLTLASYGMRTFQVSDIVEKYSNGTYITSRCVTVFAAIVLCALYTVMSGYSGTQALCIYIFLMYKLLESITDIFHGCCQKHDRMDIIGISYAARGVLSAASFCAMMIFTHNLVLTLLVMTVLCYGFSLYYDVWHSRFLLAPLGSVTSRSVVQLLKECLPLAIYVFLNTATASIPKLFLERIHGTTVMGIFHLVNSPVMILQVGVAFLFTPFITMFASKLIKKDKSGFLKSAVRISAFVAGIGIAAIAGALLIGRWGLGFLYGAELAKYSSLLVPMVVCAVLTALSLFLCMLLTVLRDMKGLIISNLIGIGVGFCASLVLVARYEMFGTTFATVTALIVQCAALCMFGMHSLRKQTAD